MERDSRLSRPNHALVARAELAMFRVLEPIDVVSAHAHRARALEAAAAAFDAGQAGSPLLVDEADLVLEGRAMRERASPLRTNFWLCVQPLVSSAPDADVGHLAAHLDRMSLEDWCRAGDRATVLESAFLCEPIRASALSKFGWRWLDLQIGLGRHASEFCTEAAGRAELALVPEHVRYYLHAGVFAVCFAIGERAIGVRGPAAYWQSYVFEVDRQVVDHG